MSPPTYKLTYFPIKALAEPIRFLLNYGKMEFDDFRVDKEKWPELKKSTPFGQIPVLEINGKMAYQSVAISRYLGKQCNLCGETDLENLEIDSIVDTITDFRAKIAIYNIEKDDHIKEGILTNLKENSLPFYLAKFDAIAEANNGYLACNKLTWADFYFVGLLDYCNGVLKFDTIDSYKNLQAVRAHVHELPAIKEWIAKRPESEY